MTYYDSSSVDDDDQDNTTNQRSGRYLTPPRLSRLVTRDKDQFNKFD